MTGRIDRLGFPDTSTGRHTISAALGVLLGAVNGLTIHSAENQIRGINMVRFALNAIRIENVGSDKNSIYGNVVGTNPSGAAVTGALNNWWGDPSGPTHPGNPGGTGDEALNLGGGMIDYNPWLVAEPTLCEVPAP